MFYVPIVPEITITGQGFPADPYVTCDGQEAVITSRPGQGTTVALYLPCVEAAKDT